MANIKRILEYYCRKCNRSFKVVKVKAEKVYCPLCKGEDLIVTPSKIEKKIKLECKCKK